MVNAKDFIKGKDFTTSKGFPEGKTIIDLETADFGTKNFTQDNGEIKTQNQVTLKVDGKIEVFNVPINVMNKIKEAVELGAAGVEVNRQGTGQKDTKYVTYPIDGNGKIVKKN